VTDNTFSRIEMEAAREVWLAQEVALMKQNGHSKAEIKQFKAEIRASAEMIAKQDDVD
jgi:hypothetical protein